MAVSHVATGAIVAGTTDAAPGYPAGIQANDALFLGVGASSSAVVTFPAITGWTLIVDLALGGGTIGAGTGPRRVGLYRKDVVDGAETGTVTVTPTGGSNVCSGAISCWRVAAGQAFSVVYETGQDTVAGTAASATAGSVIGETANDAMVGWIVGALNSNLSSQTFTATGATYGTAVEHVDAGTTNGDDQRVSFMSRPISSGTASAATVYTTGNIGTLGVVFIRLREAASVVLSAAPSRRVPFHLLTR